MVKRFRKLGPRANAESLEFNNDRIANIAENHHNIVKMYEGWWNIEPRFAFLQHEKHAHNLTCSGDVIGHLNNLNSYSVAKQFIRFGRYFAYTA
jgi:hypothetical protein